MKIWIDAQLSPFLAVWIKETFDIDAVALRDLGLRDAADEEIFRKASEAGAIVMTKDSDFISLPDRFGSPPKIIWLTCGNTSNQNLKRILTTTLADAVVLLESGEEIIEIR